MNIDLFLALLTSILSGPININFLSKETHLPVRIIEQNVHNLAKNGLVTNIGNGEVKMLEGQRLNLAVFALKEGADVERVCRALGWKEFEDLVAIALEQYNCRVTKHFRFRGSKRRYEIDVIGLKKPLILSIECKRWKQSWRRAATVKAIKMQVERTKSLAQYFPEPKDKLGVAGWREVKLIPLVLTLSNTPINMFDGVPVIPIFYFNNFLNEMERYMDELMILSVTKLIDHKELAKEPESSFSF